MNILLVAVSVLAVSARAYEPITRNYHEDIGIPLAARIKRAEEAMDFDGSRIAGGTPSALGGQPHLGGLVILLTTGQQSVCGSSLLTNTRGVTAAHCWRHINMQASQFTVVFGSLTLFSGGTRVNTNQVDVHAQYNTLNLRNDIAVYNIPHVAFGPNINKINIPTGNNQYVGVWATAAGFGLTGDNAQITQNQFKSQVNVQVITNQVCANTFGTFVVASSTLCVATPNGQSPCPGDSGGPLAIGTGNNRELIGIVSFGHRDGCTRGFPAGFVRVTALAAWIRARL